MSEPERQSMDVDIVCVGFGPATGGFLTTLSRAVAGTDGGAPIMSRAALGMPLQVLCYERADDIGFGVSGVVTRARGIKKSFPDLDPAQIPMATPVRDEKLLYLLDPVGASRRPLAVKAADLILRPVVRDLAMDIPVIPDFMHKKDGLCLSLGQFNQWVGQQVMGSGVVQVWPGMPVAQALIEGKSVKGVRLVDQGVNATGEPEGGYTPGMDIRAGLTVVGDGPVGAVGRQIDDVMGVPAGFARHEWAVGSKMVIELPESTTLKPGTVFHTLGYPEPEIFGFLYVHPDRIVSVGIFVPSWFDNPVRTSYRYLQHYIQHPALWQHLQGGTLKSWGAKSLMEAGKRGEPFLVGDGYARIGECSGSTNVLTGSGVDEAWTTGMQLAEGVVELLRADKPLSRENLEGTYVKRRRESWVESELKIAEKARDGFQRGFVSGMLGMAMTGYSKGSLNLGADLFATHERMGRPEDYFAGKISPDEFAKIRQDCAQKNVALHDAIMDRLGWPAIPFDGKLLVTHQDALLMGGKVQAPAGYADHVRFIDTKLCESCEARVCIEACSGEAIRPGPDNKVPSFDREKCVHCGACLWNCSRGVNIEFRVGPGGLHSAVN